MISQWFGRWLHSIKSSGKSCKINCSLFRRDNQSLRRMGCVYHYVKSNCLILGRWASILSKERWKKAFSSSWRAFVLKQVPFTSIILSSCLLGNIWGVHTRLSLPYGSSFLGRALFCSSVQTAHQIRFLRVCLTSNPLLPASILAFLNLCTPSLTTMTPKDRASNLATWGYT